MTAQVGDRFGYKNKNYHIVSISERIKFRPQDYGITPVSRSSACWAGYWCEYEISDSGILLKNLYVNSQDDYYPAINGITPVSAEKNSMEYFRYMGHHLYKNIDISIPYTGKILVGRDFIQEYYIHLGYQRAWGYKSLKEFIFENGMLQSELDHSAIAKELRKLIKENPEYLNGLLTKIEIPKFVETEKNVRLDLPVDIWWLK